MCAALLARAADKCAGVRACAVAGLARLQECDAAAADAVAAALDGDGAREVRCAAAGAITINPATLPSLVARATRDVASDVRTAAMRRLCTNVDWARLSVPARRDLARAAASALTPSERSAGAALLATALWIVGGDVLTFLESFDVVGAFEARVDALDENAAIGTLPRIAAEADASAALALRVLLAFADGPRPANDGGAIALAASAAVATATVDEDAENPASEDTRTGTPTLPTLWERTRDALSAAAAPAAEVTPEQALYIAARADWLSAASIEAAARGSDAEPLAAALDSLVPDGVLLYGVIASVGAVLGVVTPTDPRDDLILGDGGMDTSALRAFAGAAGVARPSELGALASLPAERDGAALAVLYAFLRAGAFVDYADEAARAAAVSTLLSILPHPGMPAWAVPLALARLRDALGAAVSRSLALATVGSLRAAVDVAIARGSSPGASQSSAARARAEAEALREAIEEAEDADAIDSGTRAAALRPELARAEAAVAASVDGKATISLSQGLLEDGHVSLGASDAAGLFWLRALDITRALLRGDSDGTSSDALTALGCRAFLAPSPSPAPTNDTVGWPLAAALIAPSVSHPDSRVSAAGLDAAAALVLAQPSPEAGRGILSSYGFADALASAVHSAASIDTAADIIAAGLSDAFSAGTWLHAAIAAATSITTAPSLTLSLAAVRGLVRVVSSGAIAPDAAAAGWSALDGAPSDAITLSPLVALCAAHAALIWRVASDPRAGNNADAVSASSALAVFYGAYAARSPAHAAALLDAAAGGLHAALGVVLPLFRAAMAAGGPARAPSHFIAPALSVPSMPTLPEPPVGQENAMPTKRVAAKKPVTISVPTDADAEAAEANGDDAATAWLDAVLVPIVNAAMCAPPTALVAGASSQWLGGGGVRALTAVAISLAVDIAADCASGTSGAAFALALSRGLLALCERIVATEPSPLARGALAVALDAALAAADSNAGAPTLRLLRKAMNVIDAGPADAISATESAIANIIAARTAALAQAGTAASALRPGRSTRPPRGAMPVAAPSMGGAGDAADTASAGGERRLSAGVGPRRKRRE